MNKKGQVIFFTFMIGITVLVLALGLTFPVKQSSNDATNYSGNVTHNGQTLDCNNDSISNFDKGACLVADLSMFYFIGGLIFMVGAILAAKVLF